MSHPDLSFFGLKELPRFGKDHLALADWRLGVPHQQNAIRSGESLMYVEHSFEHASGKKMVKLEGGSQVGLPTDHDDLFLIALLTLAAALDFPQRVYFEPSHLLHLLRLPLKDRHFKRQRAALDRLVKLNATFEGAWFDRKGMVPNGDFVTGILSEIYYHTKQGRRPKGEQPASYAVFTDNFHQSLKNGNLISIDLELLSSFRSPTAALNFRHLNKVWHSGRKPEHYSCDLRDLACGRLHMTDSRNLKANYGKVLEELEKQEYIQTTADRFEKIKRGVWRAHFDLHPSRVWEPKSAKREKGMDDKEAIDVVALYRKYRFPGMNVEPLEHEVKAARGLLDESDKEALLSVTAKVAEKVASLGKGDHYFGFAVPYYRELLAQQASIRAARRRQAEKSADVSGDLERLNRQQEAKQALHQYRLQYWRQAENSQRAKYLTAALDESPTSAERERILGASLETPPAIVLRQIPAPKHLSPTTS